MSLGLIVGGARSGKSSTATSLAARTGRPVVVVATAEGLDEEMQARIARHRADRPPGWATVEEPVELEAALAACPAGACVVVDCLSLWVANLMEAGRDDGAILEAARRAALAAASRDAPTLAVTNEVGMAIVPVNALARRYRDVLGSVNGVWGQAARWSVLAVAGQLLELADGASLLEGLAERLAP